MPPHSGTRAPADRNQSAPNSSSSTASISTFEELDGTGKIEAYQKVCRKKDRLKSEFAQFHEWVRDTIDTQNAMIETLQKDVAHQAAINVQHDGFIVTQRDAIKSLQSRTATQASMIMHLKSTINSLQVGSDAMSTQVYELNAAKNTLVEERRRLRESNAQMRQAITSFVKKSQRLLESRGDNHRTEIDPCSSEITQLNATIDALRVEIKELRAENTQLKAVVDDFLYRSTQWSDAAAQDIAQNQPALLDNYAKKITTCGSSPQREVRPALTWES